MLPRPLSFRAIGGRGSSWSSSIRGAKETRHVRVRDTRLAQRAELRRRIAPRAEPTIGVGLATGSVDAPASVEQQREQEAGSESPHGDVGVAASVRPALKRKSSEPLALVKRVTNVRALVSAPPQLPSKL